MEKTIGENAGLAFVGKNADGENEFIGKKEQWDKAKELSDKAENCEICRGSGVMTTQNGEDDYILDVCVCQLGE